jgi:ferredoxin
MILELLLARCPEVEVIRSLGREYGLEGPRFASREQDSASERCILCGLCVRVCAEVVRRSAIGFANRGVERMVATPFDSQPEECMGCGACVFVCPTGALHYEDIEGERIIAELKVSVPLVKCRACGTPFATEEHLGHIQKRLRMPKELAETCPLCRDKGHRGLMESVLGFKRSKFENASMGKELVGARHSVIAAIRYGGE